MDFFYIYCIRWYLESVVQSRLNKLQPVCSNILNDHSMIPDVSRSSCRTKIVVENSFLIFRNSLISTKTTASWDLQFAAVNESEMLYCTSSSSINADGNRFIGLHLHLVPHLMSNYIHSNCKAVLTKRVDNGTLHNSFSIVNDKNFLARKNLLVTGIVECSWIQTSNKRDRVHSTNIVLLWLLFKAMNVHLVTYAFIASVSLVFQCTKEPQAKKYYLKEYLDCAIFYISFF